jgi:hypothetical protein
VCETALAAAPSAAPYHLWAGRNANSEEDATVDELASLSFEEPDLAPAPSPPVRFYTLKRAGLAGAAAFLAVNIWTGAPLLALWVGSKAVGETVLSMRAVAIVVGVLAALVFSMAVGLAWLNGAYARLTGQRPGPSRLAWLHSMNTQDEDQEEAIIGTQISALERIVVMSVYLAVLASVAWFFFFAGSPLPK